MFTLSLSPPLAVLPSGRVTVSVRDSAGNVSRVERSFSILAAAPVNGTIEVVEYNHAALDHWFVTGIASEIAALDAGAFTGWVRSGRGFRAYATAIASASTSPVCRFYLPPPQSSHFYSASPAECAEVARQYATFVLESPAVFHIALPDVKSGQCAAGTTAVYRLYNNRFDTNHRYTTDPSIKAEMVARGYVAEGYGPDAVAMCAP